MLIVVDEDIPFAGEAFRRFGEVRPVSSRALTPAALRSADALVVRSVTAVDAALLDGAPLRFVGTATAGVDHIDLDYLQQRGIAFAHAAGANANAVAEYVVAALLHLRGTLALNLERSTLGIIGCGHVGRRVSQYAAALGLRCVLHDPPLARTTGDPRYRPLGEVLACNVITLHVPLEHGGSDPTYRLVNDAFLDAMKPGAFLINTSRGAVADTAALKRAVNSGKLDELVLDVWENEPNIDIELAETCRIATAHIAGHTLDAKRAAVQKLTDAFATHCGISGSAIVSGSENSAALACDSIPEAVRACFDIEEADRRLRETLHMPPVERARAFDALRSGWPARREFHARPLVFDDPDAEHAEILRALGFRVSVQASAGGARK